MQFEFALGVSSSSSWSIGERLAGEFSSSSGSRLSSSGPAREEGFSLTGGLDEFDFEFGLLGWAPKRGMGWVVCGRGSSK